MPIGSPPTISFGNQFAFSSTPAPSFPSFGSTSSAGILQGATSLLGSAAKFAGGYLGAQNQYTSALAESSLMRSEADIMDYNAELARWEGIIAERERDIEIDEHRDSVQRILGKNATFYAWGNIDLGDPRGTPAQIRLRNLYNAEYNEGIIIERGEIKKKQAKAQAGLYEFKASVIRSQAPLVEAGGKAARAGSLIGLAGKALKDVGAIS